LSDTLSVNRDGFLRDLRHFCRKTDRTFNWKASRGKGGHGIVTVDDRFITVQSSLTKGRIESILKQLGPPKDAV